MSAGVGKENKRKIASETVLKIPLHLFGFAHRQHLGTLGGKLISTVMGEGVLEPHNIYIPSLFHFHLLFRELNFWDIGLVSAYLKAESALNTDLYQKWANRG